MLAQDVWKSKTESTNTNTLFSEDNFLLDSLVVCLMVSTVKGGVKFSCA